jgi:hypothetical protein
VISRHLLGYRHTICSPASFDAGFAVDSARCARAVLGAALPQRLNAFEPGLRASRVAAATHSAPAAPSAVRSLQRPGCSVAIMIRDRPGAAAQARGQHRRFYRDLATAERPSVRRLSQSAASGVGHGSNGKTASTSFLKLPCCHCQEIARGRLSRHYRRSPPLPRRRRCSTTIASGLTRRYAARAFAQPNTRL